MLRHFIAPCIALTLSLPVYGQSGVTLIGEEAGGIRTILSEAGDDLMEWCQTSRFLPFYDFDPTQAQATFPLVVANAFTPDGTAPEDNLTAYVMLPPSLVPRCPDGAVEPISVIRVTAGGQFHGILQPTNISSNGHLFFAEIAFTTADVLDWELRVLATQETPFRIYGAYRLHAQPDYDGPHADVLAPDILPADWTSSP